MIAPESYEQNGVVRRSDPNCAETTPQVADRFAAGCGVIDNADNNKNNNKYSGGL